MKRRKTKTPRQKAIINADKWFSLFIRKRDKWTCFTCGKVGYEKDGIMQAGHLFTRIAHSTRWSELNTKCQCRGCNYIHEYDPHVYIIAFIKDHSMEEYENLSTKHHTTCKWTTSELVTLAAYYKKKYEKLFVKYWIKKNVVKGLK